MSRYTGPRRKVMRALGVDLPGLSRKSTEGHNHPPGQHGLQKANRKKSEFGQQLMEKQKLRFNYGVSETQLRRIVEEAKRQKGATGNRIVELLERRLDNMVFRAGWASTRPQARQFVSHGMINVNGRRVDIPSYRVRKGDVISLREKSRQMIVIRHNMDTLDRLKPNWFEMGAEGFELTVNELPERAQIDVPVREHLIVELYSK